MLILLLIGFGSAAASQLLRVGCYGPFEETDRSFRTDDEANLKTCSCNTKIQLLFLRGGQCICVDNGDLKSNRIDDSFCGVPCQDQPEFDCGLGANVYCHIADNANCWALIYNSTSVSKGNYHDLGIVRSLS